MLPKLKLKASTSSIGDGTSSPAGSAASPTVPIKLKLSASQPPTPATEYASLPFEQPVRPAKGGNTVAANKKRPANDDISPAPKKPTLKKKISIKVPPSGRAVAENGSTSALNKIKLNRKKPKGPRLTGLFASKGRPVPKRKPGEGYDSEDSDVEEDPAIQQGLVLRMQPCDDADYLRSAISDGKIGLSKAEGGADVTIRFLTADFRRAVVRVRTRLYAAVLVDLPCIIESMKSWDRKGWWKVSDVSQMLLVLGPCQGEEDAKIMPLPREIERDTWQYAHGLTPPMHWVRRRRFRKRADHRTMANVEEEVERLLKEDEDVERAGGTVDYVDHDPAEREQSYDQDQSQYGEEDAEIDAYETVEDDAEQYQDYSQMDMDPNVEDNLEDDLQAAFDANFDEGAGGGLMTESPTHMEDPSSFVAMDNGITEDSAAVTPAATPGGDVGHTSEDDEDDESDEDEDEDEDEEDSPDVVDEDAAARAAEKAQQLEEVADIEREIANVRAKVGAMTNQLLRNREMSKLQVLERELRMKKENFGLNTED